MEQMRGNYMLYNLYAFVEFRIMVGLATIKHHHIVHAHWLVSVLPTTNLPFSTPFLPTCYWYSDIQFCVNQAGANVVKCNSKRKSQDL